MSEILYRTIIGRTIMPATASDDIPKPYRRTVPLPPAPQARGSESSEPHEGIKPHRGKLDTNPPSV